MDFPDTVYSFTYMVAAPKNRAALAFTCGWLSVIAWDLASTSAVSYCAQIILNVASFLNPEYQWTQWQVYLVFVLLTIIAVAVINFMPRQLPLMEQVFFWMSISGFIATSVALVARSQHRQSASTVFVDWTNQTGWSDGTAFLLSAGSCMYMYVALDSYVPLIPLIPLFTVDTDAWERPDQRILRRKCRIRVEPCHVSCC